jgi:hypothetical protein
MPCPGSASRSRWRSEAYTAMPTICMTSSELVPVAADAAKLSTRLVAVETVAELLVMPAITALACAKSFGPAVRPERTATMVLLLRYSASALPEPGPAHR